MLWHNLQCKGGGKQHQNEVFEEFFYFMKKETKSGGNFGYSDCELTVQDSNKLKQQDSDLFRDLLGRISWDTTYEFELSFCHSQEHPLWLSTMPSY